MYKINISTPTKNFTYDRIKRLTLMTSYLKFFHKKLLLTFPPIDFNRVGSKYNLQ